MFNRQSTIFLSLVVLLGASVYWLVWPAWTQVGLMNADLAAWNSKVADARQTETQILALAKKYQKSDQADRALAALPAEEDKPGLVVQLENLASVNGFILNSVNFINAMNRNVSAKAGNSSGANAVNSGPATLNIAVELSGDVKSLNGFLDAVEKNLRIMDVQSISFRVPSPDNADKTTSFSVNLNTYYRTN